VLKNQNDAVEKYSLIVCGRRLNNQIFAGQLKVLLNGMKWNIQRRWKKTGALRKRCFHRL